MRVGLPALLLLTSCQGSGSFAIPRPALALTVEEPAYGAFVGEGPVVVAGRVTDASALVWVEGRAVNVGTDGSFRVTLPVGGPYRVIDVEASSPEVHLRQRLPVFEGEDPLRSWPGAVTLRIGPAGLDGIAEDLGPTVDGLVGGIFADPAVVSLTPGDAGLALAVTLSGAAFSFEVAGFPVTLGVDEVVLGATLRPEVDADGRLALAVTDSTVSVGQPIVEAGALDPLILEDWLDGLLEGVSGAVEAVVDGLIAGLGSLTLGGPIAFETDLLGTPLALSVDALWTDPEGIGGRLGAVLGDGAAPPAEIPAPGADVGFGRADLALGVHEGLFQLLLTSELLTLLEQDLELPGILADVVGLTIAALPGGSDAPTPEAWCLKVSPGQARAARLQSGTDPLARLYLPDLRIELGYSDPGVACADWLVASLDLEVDVAVRDGTVLDLGLRVADGAVLEYATTHAWDEDGVIDGLGGLLETVVGLAGGSLALDLGDLLGGGLLGTEPDAGSLLGDLDPRVITSEPLYDGEGPIDGLFALSLDLWD